jgi:uncharacterized protein YndB with AHSA1/START domain
MVEPAKRTAAALSVRQTYESPREHVFHAFTDAASVKKWWIPAPGFSVPDVEIDLRVGGAYRITMQGPDGGIGYVRGNYREVVAPEKLVYTFQWEAPHDAKKAIPFTSEMREAMNVGETLVTVVFRAMGKSTEVVVTHELVANQDQLTFHDFGWRTVLARLAQAL